MSKCARHFTTHHQITAILLPPLFVQIVRHAAELCGKSAHQGTHVFVTSWRYSRQWQAAANICQSACNFVPLKFSQSTDRKVHG